MHPDLTNLLDLQAKDAALSELDDRRSQLDAEASVFDEELHGARERLETAERAASDAARRRDELEAKIESYRALQERRRLRLEFVRNPKEASTLMAEMDLGRSVISKEEGDWVRSADQVTALQTAAADEARKVEQLKAEQAPRRVDLAARRAELDGERAVREQARDASANRVERSLRARYDRLRRARANAVVVPLNGDGCGSCFTAVPRNRRSQIRAGLLLDGCEACGVILYAADE
jgi:predicted  nucleic acid-binding Zn-ribbon protein